MLQTVDINVLEPGQEEANGTALMGTILTLDLRQEAFHFHGCALMTYRRITPPKHRDQFEAANLDCWALRGPALA